MHIMVLLTLFTACSGDPLVESMYLSGGNWQVQRSEDFKARVEGVALRFQSEQRQYYYCIFECTGVIEWPNPILKLDTNNVNLLIDEIDEMTLRATNSTVTVKNSHVVDIHGIQSDILVNAVPNSSISVLSSYGDVDVNLPSDNWHTRIFGDEIINQIESKSIAKNGYLEVYSINGTIRIIEVYRMSKNN
jgi:hypothetical protein